MSDNMMNESMPSEERGRLEALSDKELETLYKERVGIPPRGYPKELLIAGIIDPEAEYARVAEIDREDDAREKQEEVERMSRRR